MGAVWTLAIGTALGLGAYRAVRFGWRQPSGLPRVLATTLIAWAWLTIGIEVLGGAGFLARGTLLAWAVLGLAIGFVSRGPGALPNEPKPAREPWSWAEIVTGAIVLWPSSLLGASSLLRPVKVVSDGPIYHLYFAARWWKAGSLEAIPAPFGENAATYFPAVGDLWFTALMTAWDGDRLAKVGQVPFGIVAGLTVVALAMRLGARRGASIIAASWFLTASLLFLFTFEPNVDTIFAAAYLLSTYFLVRHDLGDDGGPSLMLGALACGCALGTKAPAVVFVPPLLAWGVVSALRKGVGWPDKLRRVGMIVGLPWLVAGFWFVRNAWWTGNPLYPLHLKAFGHVWLRGWYGPEVMWRSQYYLPVSDWRSFLDILASVLDPRLLPVWVLALAGLWRVGKRSETDRYVGFVAALAVANVALYWLLVPYRTQQRFMIQAVGLAAVPLARLFDRGTLARWLGVMLLAVHVFTSQSWPFSAGEPPWDLSPQIPNTVAGLVRWPTLESFRGGLLRTLLVLTASVGVGLASFGAVWAWAAHGERAHAEMMSRRDGHGVSERP